MNITVLALITALVALSYYIANLPSALELQVARMEAAPNALEDCDLQFHCAKADAVDAGYVKRRRIAVTVLAGSLLLAAVGISVCGSRGLLGRVRRFFGLDRSTPP